MTIAKPALSVNKVAEYIDSKGARQRALLKQRKYPDEDFTLGMYHREAAEAVSSYIAGGMEDTTILTKQIHSLNQVTGPKLGTLRRASSNVNAIENFLEMLDNVNLGSMEPSLGAHSVPKLTYHNVEISVRPDIIIRGKSASGKSTIGAWKLNFSLGSPFNEDMSGHVSALIQEYLRLHLAEDNEIVSALHCQVLDVATKRLFPGVKAITNRMKDIAAECQNIAALWPSI